MIVEIFATTDNGQRSGQNEDNFAVCKDLASKSWGFKPHEKISLSDQGAVMLVADGMGGANAGEVASDIAQKMVQTEFNKLIQLPATDKLRANFLKKVIEVAHEEIVAHQMVNLGTAGMGTTLIVLWVVSGKAYVAWCGDSRLYICKKGIPLKPATDDHSYVWELVKQGKISPEEARLHPESNIITQSLGDPSTPPNSEVKIFELEKDDRLLLCSDGLNSMLDDEHIDGILKSDDDTVEVCKKLVAEANAAGGRDNITVVLLDVREGDPTKTYAGPVASTTQELRKFISNRNKIIGLLSILLLCLVGYIILAYTIQQQAPTKGAPTTSLENNTTSSKPTISSNSVEKQDNSKSDSIKATDFLPKTSTGEVKEHMQPSTLKVKVRPVVENTAESKKKDSLVNDQVIILDKSTSDGTFSNY